MKVWLIRDLEPTPLDGNEVRLLRAGMLSRALSHRGHETIWFTSAFNHYSRKLRPPGRFNCEAGLTIEVLPGQGYRNNIGFARLLHNARFGRHFVEAARRASDRPDLILADMPTTEAASAAVRFGRETGLPTVVTVRDLWPDFFAEFFPKPLRPLIDLGLRRLDQQARYACRNATSLIGISEDYLAWGQRKGERNSSLDRVFHLGYPRPDLFDERSVDEVMSQFEIPRRAKVAAFVGSWGVTYDLPLLLQTAELLKDQEDLIMAVAGDWTLRPDLAAAFRRLPNVRILGWLDKNQVSALLSRSFVGLLPYRSNAPQGLPNKIFEYMAYGVYQITTLSGEAARLLEETGSGRRVDAGSVHALAAAIQDALIHETDEDMRRLRRATFQARFEASKIYDSLIDHLELVVKGYSEARLS